MRQCRREGATVDPEKPAKARLRQQLESDFVVHEGWTGTHRNADERVRYDLVLQPRDHLIAEHFDVGYVVVEVKLFNEGDAVKHDLKAKDLLWQCVTYSYSDIPLHDGSTAKPLFVLYYIAGSGIAAQYLDRFNTVRQLVVRGGVGTLEFDGDDNWAMRFGGSYYYRKRNGRGPHNVGRKRMVGSTR